MLCYLCVPEVCLRLMNRLTVRGRGSTADPSVTGDREIGGVHSVTDTRIAGMKDIEDRLPGTCFRRDCMVPKVCLHISCVTFFVCFEVFYISDVKFHLTVKSLAASQDEVNSNTMLQSSCKDCSL